LGKLPRIFTDILDRLLLKIQLARRFRTFAGVYRRHPLFSLLLLWLGIKLYSPKTKVTSIQPRLTG